MQPILLVVLFRIFIINFLGVRPLRGRVYLFIFGLSAILIQLVFKSIRILVVLLILEALMLFTAFSWIRILSYQGAAPQELFRFLIIRVCEARLGLAVAVQLVREKGEEGLIRC